mgnify:FL=1
MALAKGPLSSAITQLRPLSVLFEIWGAERRMSSYATAGQAGTRKVEDYVIDR